MVTQHGKKLQASDCKEAHFGEDVVTKWVGQAKFGGIEATVLAGTPWSSRILFNRVRMTAPAYHLKSNSLGVCGM